MDPAALLGWLDDFNTGNGLNIPAGALPGNVEPPNKVGGLRPAKTDCAAAASSFLVAKLGTAAYLKLTPERELVRGGTGAEAAELNDTEDPVMEGGNDNIAAFSLRLVSSSPGSTQHLSCSWQAGAVSIFLARGTNVPVCSSLTYLFVVIHGKGFAHFGFLKPFFGPKKLPHDARSLSVLSHSPFFITRGFTSHEIKWKLYKSFCPSRLK